MLNRQIEVKKHLARRKRVEIETAPWRRNYKEKKKFYGFHPSTSPAASSSVLLGMLRPVRHAGIEPVYQTT
jgi:hypothetical protein